MKLKLQLPNLFSSKLLAAFAALIGAAPAFAQDLPHYNFENHPIHALDLSPNKRLLAIAHTADARVQLMDVSAGLAVSSGHVVVGFDPVSVRFRNDSQLWVVNHVSDSISVIDVQSRRVIATLATADEPFDVVFAAGKAFVSCSQANTVQVFDVADLRKAPINIPIDAEDPRALAVSPDGRFVYAAIFESGNATTILSGGLAMREAGIPNVVSHASGPYAGQNPPPNLGQNFSPAMNPASPAPPAVGLVVRKGADQRWRDDNNRDWSDFVSGSRANLSGRKPGWDMPDRDIAVIDTASLTVRYETGLMNIGMALAVNPAAQTLTLIGTEAFNEVRFEPNLNGHFVRSHMAVLPLARTGANTTLASKIVDLNPHLNYQSPQIPEVQRQAASTDPRSIVWQQDGQRGFVAGMGSNNVIVIDAAGNRLSTLAVGEGPAGLALDESRNRLYVWNHFSVTLSVVDTTQLRELDRKIVFNPLPRAIRAGRQYLYDGHKTSGLGQVACASCHVDARMDKLAWDLGDPSKLPAKFDQVCATSVIRACEDFHAMKGPMVTQTMQDIIGHEPHHWRGDRTGIRAFNPTYTDLMGDDEQLEEPIMQLLNNFLATVRFPPNPFRNLDNSLPENLPLPGQYTSGRFAMPGIALPPGNAKRGVDLYTKNLLASPFQCASCHTLPTGMGVNGPVLVSQLGIPVGMGGLPRGVHGENRLGVVSTDGSTNVSMKTPHLRNMHEKVGLEFSQSSNAAGFGFLHDGSVDSLAKFFSASVFSPRSDQDVADLVALMMAFSGSDFGTAQPPTSAPVPISKDAHAAVGQQVEVQGSSLSARALALLAMANAGKVELIAHSGSDSFVYQRSSQDFRPSAAGALLSVNALAARASINAPQVWMAMPLGLGNRFGLDRDGDGVSDQIEVAQGSNPAESDSKTLRARSGMYYNPARSGHGFDLQYAGEFLFITWFTYLSDGSPVWYQASARLQPGTVWQAPLNQFRWDALLKRAVATPVGSASVTPISGKKLRFDWVLGAENGTESMQVLLDGAAPNPNLTGAFYNPIESGWGITVESDAATRIAVAFFYDGNGAARWSLGQGDNAARALTLPMLSYRGFCPSCAAITTTNVAGGSLQMSLAVDNTLSIAADLRDPATPNAPWQKSSAAFQPLSTAEVRPEDQ